jgi:predicted Zn-dependent peptidase
MLTRHAPSFRVVALSSCLAGAFACGGADAGRVARIGPPHLDLPSPATSRGQGYARAESKAREAPPSAMPAKESPFPKVARSRLASGLEVAVVESHALPLVHVRLLVRAGSGYQPDTPGTAEITAQMLKDGGTLTMTSAQLLSRIESLGATLDVHVAFDSSVLGLAVPKTKLAEALEILAEVVEKPRFDETELKKLKGRLTDEAKDRARADGTWMAMRSIFRELYPANSPYAAYGLVPSEIEKVRSANIRDFHKRFYVPKAATLVLAGDIDATAVAALAKEKMGAWRGGDPPKVDFPEAVAARGRRVIVANRPKSAQSDVFVVGLAPERQTPAWPDLRVANQVLGGGVASRLFLDVREQRSLAYSARSQIVELTHGKQPFLLYAGTQTSKTVQAADGLLENLDKIEKEGVAQGETQTARRYLSDIFAVRMETVGAIADLVVLEDELGLPNGYWDKYREQVRAVEADRASAAARTFVGGDRALLVVAGDADVIAAPLAKFGPVTVVDPEKDFSTVRTLPAAALRSRPMTTSQETTDERDGRQLARLWVFH